jgi:hypothetical protein
MAVTTLALGYVPQAGVTYTHITDNSGDFTSGLLPNNTYFYNKADKLVYFKDSTGAIRSPFPAGLGFTPENTANKGVANGYAGLDGAGRVPATQLPSYVDDVIEVANFAALPVTGETGKIYITLDTNKVYRWSGTVYVEVAQPNAVWGGITGTLGSQTDLQNALNAKQNTLVSATNIKTVNGNSLLGSGDLTIGGGGSNELLLYFAGSVYSPAAGSTYVMGGSSLYTPALLANESPRFRVICPRAGNVVSLQFVSFVGNVFSTSEGIILRVFNRTTGVFVDATTTYGLNSLALINRARNDNFILPTPLFVNAGDQLQIRIICPAWTTPPTDVYHNATLYIQ